MSGILLCSARAILYNLKERVYKLYVLRRIEAAESGEVIFDRTPLTFGRNAFHSDWPHELRTRLQKWILIVDEENDFLFCDELVKGISIIIVPSTNREDVLRTIRHVLPGSDTERVYFWFGTQYINNANLDYGQLITEACHHFTTHLGHVHQYVVLPPYNRSRLDTWTSEVLNVYLQREQLLPHARVILHPYDVSLWYYDQLKLQKRGVLPPWTDRYQSADGTTNNWSTVEARKFNMREWHGSDLWTWYKGDVRAKPYPPSIDAKLGANGDIIKPRTTNAICDHHDEADSESDCPPGNRSTASAEVVPSVAAVTSPTNRVETDATFDNRPEEAESESACPPGNCSTTGAAVVSIAAASTADDSEIEAALLRMDKAQLAPLLELAAKKAVDQLTTTFQPQIDDLTRRLEALLKKRTTAKAEHRHQDPRTDQ
ncbi:hypothetical protein AAVH_21121 [Aphelenchoides avenae]|nr:hypothetical protein AAVH_21121 [Aphelenchus avenae]